MRFARTLCLVAGVAAALLGHVRPADATVMLALDLKQLVARADGIFVGQVVSTRTRWSGRRIVTDASVRVERDIDGVKRGSTVVVTRLGGTVNGIGMRVAGVAVLRKGERVLLFTQKRAGHRYVVGMAQGLFRVAKAASGKLELLHATRHLALVKRTTSGLVSQASALPRRVDLASFITTIKSTLATCRADARACRAR